MARNGIVAALALALAGALVACGGEADAAEGPDLAALRARNDSLRQARAATAAAAAATDTAVDTLGAGTGETAVLRETFVYTGGTRDPFGSLLTLKSSGPELVDLQLVGIYHNIAAPSQSVAVLRERGSGKRWKLRAGDRIGRMRVTQIQQKDVVFAVSDFGYERQETLSLRKPLEEDDTP